MKCALSEPARKIQTLVWGGLILVALVILAVFLFAPPPAKPLPVYGDVPDFSLSDENGRIISRADWRGQICVADLIFTRCAGQCLLMAATLNQLPAALPPRPSVRLVSLTSDPAFDTPSVLKKYGERFGAREGVWTFLTGPKEKMRQLAMDGLKLNMVDKEPSEQETPVDLVIHSTKLVLIDQRGRIRGYFDGRTPDCIPPILAAIQNLAREK